MTEQDKQLLLKDLCARLPYGVMVQTPELPFCMDSYVPNPIGNLHIDGSNICISYKDEKNNTVTCSLDWYLWQLRPYLRPISSMTEAECSALFEKLNIDIEGGDWIKINDIGIIRLYTEKGKDFEDIINGINYLDSIYIDYRSLIEKGLALEAPENMYEF